MRAQERRRKGSGVLLFPLAALLLLGVHCPGSRPAPSPSVPLFLSIPLGNDKNVVRLSKPVFLGHRIARFRLRLRVANPGRTAPWIVGLEIGVAAQGAPPQRFTSLPESAASDGSFWTEFVSGNQATISAFSSSLVSFSGGSPELQILEVDREFDPAEPRLAVPLGAYASGALTLATGYEAIGISPESGDEAQHFAFFVWNPQPTTVGVYLSPFLPGLWNDIGLRAAISTESFKSAGDPEGWLEPVRWDTGIYREIAVPPRTAHLLVSVRTGVRAPYFASVQVVKETFREVVAERAANLPQPAGVNLDDLRDRTSETFPYGVNLAKFLAAQPSIDRRISEVAILASAKMLDGSDGHLRFGSLQIFQSISVWRDVDIQFRRQQGRAHREGDGSRITMFANNLDEPFDGGWTLHHEWGHYEYGMPDEYVDVTRSPPAEFSLAIDPNSVMGTRSASDFCHRFNHLFASSLCGTEDSMWELLSDQYGLPQMPDSGGVHQGRYLDVLGQLEDLMKIEVFP